RADAGADEPAPEKLRRPARKLRREEEARSHDRDRDDQREKAELRPVGGRKPGLEGEHGDEMGRPGAGPGRKARQEQPAVAAYVRARPRPPEEAIGDKAGEEADQGGEPDELPVVIVHETVV